MKYLISIYGFGLACWLGVKQTSDVLVVMLAIAAEMQDNVQSELCAKFLVISKLVSASVLEVLSAWK